MSLEIVVAWLDAAYLYIEDVRFQAEEQDMSSETKLYQLLAFADAVGSKKRLISSIANSWMDEYNLNFCGTLGGKERGLWPGQVYCFEGLKLSKYLDDEESEKVALAASDEEKKAFMSSVAIRMEQLLFISLKLDLPELLQAVQEFLTNGNITVNAGFLDPVWDQIMSSRVLDAAAVRGLAKDALVKHLATDSLWSLVSPTEGMDNVLKKEVGFMGVLKKDVFGCTKGQQVVVEVQLYDPMVKGAWLTIAGHSVALDLQVGRMKMACQYDKE